MAAIEDLHAIAAAHGCESLHLCSDPATGLRAIVAVHSTVLGPSLGGTRFRPYADRRRGARRRLPAGPGHDLQARGVRQRPGRRQGRDHRRPGDAAAPRRCCGPTAASSTRSAAATSPPRTSAPPRPTWTSSARSRRTSPAPASTLGGSGDPSPATAWGVLHAMGAVGAAPLGHAVARRAATSSCSASARSARALARHLHEAGARLTLADVRTDAVAALAAELGAATSSPAAEAHAVECDILSPCALGAVLDPTIDPRAALRGGVRRGQQPAGHRRRRRAAGRGAASSTPPTTWPTPAASSTSPTRPRPAATTRPGPGSGWRASPPRSSGCSPSPPRRGHPRRPPADHLAEERPRRRRRSALVGEAEVLRGHEGPEA